jgi:hypothetical protein
MKGINRRVELPSHVDVTLRGLIALMTHQGLQGIRGQVFRVQSCESSPQIMEPVDVAEAGMLVLPTAG